MRTPPSPSSSPARPVPGPGRRPRTPLPRRARSRRGWIPAGLALLALAAGAAPSLARVAGSAQRVLVHDGLTRTYLVHRPAGLARSVLVPLVVMLHGGFGNGRQARQDYGWDGLADTARFVVAYPDGVAATWNAGECCGAGQRRNVDDVGFLAGMLDEIVASDSIDPTRIFVTGMSNGAMMAYRLACELPGRLAAIGPVAGTMTSPCESPEPLSVLAIHGLDDQNLPYDGRPGSEGVVRQPHMPVPSAIAHWREVDGTGAPSVTTAGPVHTDRATAPSGQEVTLITIDGAGHEWPGGRRPGLVSRVALGLDPPSRALDATNELWQFFSHHPAGR